MVLRRRLHALTSLALAAPVFIGTALAGSVVSVAHAQGEPAPVVAPGSSSAPNPEPAPPPSSPAPRPPLITPDSTTPAAGSAGDTPSSATGTVPGSAAPATVSPGHDQPDLSTQSAQRPEAGELVGAPQQTFSEDWWGRARPVIELHGFFRTRAELFQNFALGRHSSSLQGNDPQYLWPQPLDESYSIISPAGGSGGTRSVNICGSASPPTGTCYDKTESGANMRLRLDPEIDISDNLRIVSEVDLLDNVVLGSTPDSYAIQPASSSTATGTSTLKTPTGYQSAGYNAYSPVGFFSSTQGPPTAGVNSSTNSIDVKRVWGEYMTPVGQLRFGRMPSQWGLGMVDNAGDGIDSDYQTTVDRIMFVTGIKSMDVYFGGAWDFVSSGPTALPGASTANVWDVYGGQPYNTCNLCNVSEWAAWAAHRTNPDLQRLSLARGDVVVNGGLYAKFRSQYLDVSTQNGQTAQTIDTTSENDLEPRHAWSLTPDLWVQLLWRTLRIEAEASMIWGEIGSLPGLDQASIANPVDIREFGIATQTEYRAIEDKLDLQFGFGYASGDPWAYNSSGSGVQGQGALQPSGTGVQNEFNNGPMSTFRFHPDYRVDLIFFRNILTRVEGAYYFRPSVDYDFIRHSDGEKIGGGLAIIYSRASQFVQTPGHHDDLGVELDAQLYYQSKDGSLNDDPSKIGGFYAMLQYGVFFPFGGLDYLGTPPFDAGLSAAQIVRLFLGIVF
jgi:uncharacterized protein (TIGR04551 family)